MGIGVGSTLPLSALVLTARGFGPDQVGWMVAISAAGGIAGTLASPALTGRFGRRWVMLGCVALSAASVMLLQRAESWWSWAALRAVFGASIAPLFVLGEAWINTLPSDAVRGRVVAIYTTSFTLCQLAGPVLTDALARAPHAAFLICGGVFLLGIPGIALARDEPALDPPRRASNHPGASTPPEASAAHAVSAARMTSVAPMDSIDTKNTTASWLDIIRTAPTIVAGAGLFAAFDTIALSFLPLVALDHGMSRDRALGAVFIVLAGDAMLQFAAGYLADRFGRARVHAICGVCACVLLPLLPAMIRVPGLWESYLFVLGGVAGALYTLSMVSSGERFSGAALVRASGLIALTWNLASSVGPAATGIAMQHLGSDAVTAVLWIMALGFMLTARIERRSTAPVPAPE